MTKKIKEEIKIGKNPIWKCSPAELRKFCAEKNIPIQEGLRQYQLVAVIKNHFEIEKLKTNETPENSSVMSLEEAKKVMDERSVRAKKMIMPHQVPVEEKKKVSTTTTEKTIDKAEEKRIMNLKCKKHYKMWLLHKGGYSRQEIATLLTINNNTSYVRNEIIKYEQDPEREAKYTGCD